ncbi:unnamed protein product [Larinioides sclopetarius]|uniref:Bestrophin homolog n=1 Tax=Larinioides sclopetarius TaxID=280406 RepID=A0AAV1ZI71_9ARAC
MTVSYQYDVASSASGGFIRLLFRWRGSVWKVVYREMLLFSACYITLSLLYNFALTDGQQKIFERIVYFCSTFMDLIPLSFMLGFYVSFIAARWWSQFIAIPWPDKLMNIVAMYIPGLDESSRVVRRTLMRYLNLSLVLVLRSISMAVKRRFPTKEHLIEAGFMTKTELEMFQSVPSTEFNTFWIPCTWFINVLREARQECRITDSNGLKLIMEELNEFRSKCGLLWGYDWISIPLVYTQVVTMATYAFFVACMFGRQNVNIESDKPSSPEVHRYDYYIPIFTILQLMFYMGLLKVAEQLINPFGDDDEDFELNWIIDRHMKVSYLGVDTLNGTPPPLVKDTYYDELDVKIPYTEASKSYKKKTYRGSVAYMQVPMEQQGMVLPDMSEEEDDGETVSEGMGIRRPSLYSLFQSRGKGVSPAASFTNLDNRSIASIDSDWKRSLPDLSTVDVKNASGTLGFSEISPKLMDMDKAEDDEIVLQEVIVEQNNIRAPAVVRSNSLQIPGTSVGFKKDALSKVGMLIGLSPKIAPKFPREKLKSMFKRRKLSAALPFHKIKGVRFSRDTKDDDESESESLLNISDEPVEVAITLSSPELTEAEKESGTHPYYFTQQTITSSKQLPMERAFTVRQSSLTRSESEEDKISKALKVKMYIPRCSSMPNIQRSDSIIPYIHDPIIASSLKKISKAEQKKKSKRKIKRKKSPPLRPEPFSDDMSDSGREKCDDMEFASDTDSPSRRNTLPQITLTKCDPHAPEHLDLATSPNHSSSQSSDSGMQESATQMLPSQPTRKEKEQSFRKPSTSTEKHITSDKAPDQHSKPTGDSSKHQKIKDSTVQKETTTKKDEPRIGTQASVIIPIEDVEETPTTSSGEAQKHHSRSRKAPAHLKLQIKPDSKESTAEAETKQSPIGAVRKESPQSPVRTPPSEPSTHQSYKTIAGRSPEVHSTPTSTARESASASDGISKGNQPKRKSPPPPRRSSPSPIRPESLRFATKRGSVPSKKIAGISLAATKPKSPTTDIPRGTKVDRSPSFPKPSIKLTTPSKSSPTMESPVTPETPKYFGAEASKDIQESKDQKSRQPPDAPKRHRPHSSSKEKK